LNGWTNRMPWSRLTWMCDGSKRTIDAFSWPKHQEVQTSGKEHG
jgi:hypothetical protein